MRIAFLGGIFPQENICEILANSHGVVQSAADALQKSILEGLGAYRDDIDIINLPNGALPSLSSCFSFSPTA